MHRVIAGERHHFGNINTMVAAQHDASPRRDVIARGDKRPPVWQDILVWCSALAGVVSVVAAVLHAVPRSQDFQWSGERLLLQHIDPWRDFLLGDPAHGLLATQVPNYLPVLYILLIPFGLLSASSANFLWALCNATFAIGSALLAARFYGFRSWRGMLGITGIMLAAAPTRISISNGQQGLLVLALWSVALLTTAPLNAPRAMLAGISYLKYSFAPALALFLLLRDGLRKGIRSLLWSGVPSAVATILVWLWITRGRDSHHLLALITEPLAVTRVGYQPTGDPLQTFMDLLEFLMGGGPVGTPRLTLISLVAAVLITVAVLLPALRRRFPRTGAAQTDRAGWLLALVATMSFVLYKHHTYDAVVFLFPFCYALRHWRRSASLAALFLISYCWFVQPSVDLRVGFSIGWFTTRISILFALLLCVYRIAEPELAAGTVETEAAC